MRKEGCILMPSVKEKWLKEMKTPAKVAVSRTRDQVRLLARCSPPNVKKQLSWEGRGGVEGGGLVPLGWKGQEGERHQAIGGGVWAPVPPPSPWVLTPGVCCGPAGGSGAFGRH